jgi:hypothetical protein
VIIFLDIYKMHKFQNTSLSNPVRKAHKEEEGLSEERKRV